MPPEIVFPHLGIELQSVSRVAFNILGINIYMYGICLGLGLLLGALTAYRIAKNTGQNLTLYYDFTFIVVITSVIGARLYYVIFSWDTYKDNLLEIFNFRNGGLAIYGVVIAAVITAIVFTRVKKTSFFLLADTGACGLLVGQFIGRWGNFFNKEAFGEYTNSLFAMQLMKTDVAQSSITQKMLDNIVVRNGVEYIQVHPTFLYESVWNFLVFVGLYFYTKHKKFDGEIFFLYLLFYGIGRFFVEGLRTDQLKLFQTGIPVSQLLSAILAIFALGAIIYKRIKIKKTVA